MSKVLNPIGETMAASIIGAKTTRSVSDVLEFLQSLPQRKRVVAMQVITDYFCPHCAVEQPPGDCQCQKR